MIYELRTEQFLPISKELAWEFFSSPLNLKKITPEHLDFRIVSLDSERGMYPGMIIRYYVRPLLGIAVGWTTEITHVKDMDYFVDEQRFGPYTLWHHKHYFKEVEGGVLMTDWVHYKLPLGILGRFAHWLFVKKQLKQIFDYRKKTLEQIFPVNTAKGNFA